MFSVRTFPTTLLDAGLLSFLEWLMSISCDDSAQLTCEEILEVDADVSALRLLLNDVNLVCRKMFVVDVVLDFDTMDLLLRLCAS